MALTVSSRPLVALSADQIETVHQASLRIVEETGIAMLDDQALDVMAAAGATVDWAAKRVRIPRDVVMQAVARAPEQFTLHARNPIRDAKVGGDTLLLVPVGGPAMAADLDEGRRPGTYADQINFIKLSQYARLLDVAYRCVEAQDLPPLTRHLDYLYAAIRYSDKPLAVMSMDGLAARDSLAMAALLFGGEDQIRKWPALLGGVNVDSPLRFSPETLQTIIAFARAGQPLKITPFALPGVMSPVTLAGSLVQENAEVLCGITLAELVNPGTPVVYGSFATQTDMRSASPVFGTADGLRMEIAAGDLARRYRLPHRGMGLTTTAHLPDERAAIDKMNCLWSLTLSNVHMLLHAAGWLEGGITASYEQFILDLDMLESMEQLLAGFSVDEESLALDTISTVGPGGDYLSTDHTLTNFRRMAHLSPLVDSRPYDIWRAAGAPTTVQQANAIWKVWLRDYEEPPLDPAIDSALRDYVSSRKRETRHQTSTG